MLYGWFYVIRKVWQVVSFFFCSLFHRIPMHIQKMEIHVIKPQLRKVTSWEKNLADLCGYGAAVTCQSWRSPRTTTTISWCDGELGPLFVTFGDGQVKDSEVDEINETYAGTLHVEHSCKKTHMWNGEVCVKYLDFIAKEIRRKRLSLGYKDAAEAPCLALCDRAPSHQSQVFQKMRANWAKQHNVILLGADCEGPCPVPGGFGATMQPNDRWEFTTVVQKIEKQNQMKPIYMYI